MRTILAFLFVLGVLIFVHELGHFLAARRLGIRVLTFSLGFGPKILKITRGGTEYCISAVPLGGYVKMAGESPEDPRSGAPDEFLSKSKWERFQVLIMGPVMNIVLAVVVLAFVLAQGAEVPAYLDKPALVGVVQQGSPAEKGGLRPGDRIVSVAGEAVPAWKDMERAVAMQPNKDIVIAVDRAGTSLALNVRPAADRYEVGDIGVLPDTSAIVKSVVGGSPAEVAGVIAGDVIVAINGERVVFAQRLASIISKSPGKEIELSIKRHGENRGVHVTPGASDGKIGVTLSEETRSFKPGPIEAVKLSISQNTANGLLIFKTLGGLFTGATSVRQLQGPVGIAQLSGESAEAGFTSLLSLMVMLSLNLGLLNLMPVPVLDGGHILIIALEGVARRDFSMQVKEKMLLGGFVVLMMLMVTVVYNDLTRITWLQHLMPWRN